MPSPAGSAQQRGRCFSDAGLQARDKSAVLLMRRVSEQADLASPMGLHLLLEVFEALFLLRDVAPLLAAQRQHDETRLGVTR